MTEKNDILIQSWPIDKPIPYARNARVISPQAAAAVAGSIKEFGFRNPILVDPEGVIIAGHTRLRAAQMLGMSTVPVMVATDLSPAQVQAYRLVDNRVGEFTEWDRELLEIELGDVGSIDLTFAGFDTLLASLSGDPGLVPDDEGGGIGAPITTCPKCGHTWGDER